MKIEQYEKTVKNKNKTMKKIIFVLALIFTMACASLYISCEYRTSDIKQDVSYSSMNKTYSITTYFDKPTAYNVHVICSLEQIDSVKVAQYEIAEEFINSLRIMFIVGIFSFLVIYVMFIIISRSLNKYLYMKGELDEIWYIGWYFPIINILTTLILSIMIIGIYTIPIRKVWNEEKTRREKEKKKE